VLKKRREEGRKKRREEGEERGKKSDRIKIYLSKWIYSLYIT
jgi:hypothetical protein